VLTPLSLEVDGELSDRWGYIVCSRSGIEMEHRCKREISVRTYPGCVFARPAQVSELVRARSYFRS
jgi:hypothetical protein